ncbi:exosortase E/protease, VPEID-CTERM system [Isosphaeraceae bacterium EP7]
MIRATGRAAWVALLLVEAGALSARYHWTSIPEPRIGQARWLVEPAFPAALASAIAVVPALRRRGRGDEPAGPLPRWPFVLGQPVAFLAYARSVAWLLTEDLAGSPYLDARLIGRLHGDPHDSPAAACWLAGSALLGAASLALWVAALIVPPARRPWRWPGWVPLGAGLGFGAAAVAAGWAAQATWPGLGHATFWLVHRLLATLPGEVVSRPAESVLGIDGFTVWIAPACSGYEGIGLVLVYLGVVLWVDRRGFRFPRALLLLPLGAVAIWLANAIRLAALVAVGAWVSPAAARRGFHAQAGWLAFNAVALGLVALARRTRALRRGPGSARAVRPTPSAPYLMPMLAMVAAAMITGAFSDGFDRLYPARVLAALAALAWFRRRYPGLRRAASREAVALGVLVFALWLASGALGPATAPGGDAPARWADLPPAWGWPWLIARVVGSVLVAPLVEELAFRGFLLRRLISADFEGVTPGRLTWASLLISSLLFGALHDRWLAGAAAGAIYALAWRRRGELADAVAAHATTNGLLAAHALASGDWSSWS